MRVRTFAINALVGHNTVSSPIKQWENAVKHNGYVRAPGPLRMIVVGGLDQVHALEGVMAPEVGYRYVRVSGMVR